MGSHTRLNHGKGSAMRTFAFLAYIVLTGGLLWAFTMAVWNYIKAWDVNFSVSKADQHNKKVDMKAAHCEAIVLPQLAVPLGVVVIALMAYNQFRPADQWWQIYTIIAIFWFISAPARRYWVNYTTIRVDKRLRELAYRKDSEGLSHKNYTAKEATKLYYRNGIRSQRRQPSTPQSMLFVGRLKFLNRFAWAWRWLRYLRVGLPVLVECLMALVWPFSATAMTLIHSVQAMDTLSLHPWWERH